MNLKQLWILGSLLIAPFAMAETNYKLMGTYESLKKDEAEVYDFLKEHGLSRKLRPAKVYQDTIYPAIKLANSSVFCQLQIIFKSVECINTRNARVVYRAKNDFRNGWTTEIDKL